MLEAANLQPKKKSPARPEMAPAPVIRPFAASQLLGRAWAVFLGGRQGCDMGLISALSTLQGPSAVPVASVEVTF